MITSIHNEQVKQTVRLQQRKERQKSRQYVIEGWRFAAEAVARRAPILKVFVDPERATGEREQEVLHGLIERSIPLLEVDRRVMAKLCLTEEPQGILAVLAQPAFSWQSFSATLAQRQPGEDGLSPAVFRSCLVIDGVQDPGNLGTLLRTALAAGVRNVVLTKGTVDLYNPKVLRSTMGAIFSLNLMPEQESAEIIRQCMKIGLTLLMADAGGQSLYETEEPLGSGPCALIVGNEGNGPGPLFREKAGKRVGIPMENGVESLNAAMAAGLIMYEFVRRNKKNKP